MTWQYVYNPISPNTAVMRELADGRQESHLVTAPIIQEFLTGGGEILPADEPPAPAQPTKAELLARIEELAAQVAALP